MAGRTWPTKLSMRWTWRPAPWSPSPCRTPTKESDATKLLKLRLGQAAIGTPVGPQVERTTLGEILKMVEVDYAANGRKSLARVKHAARHLKEFFDALSKARVLTSDRITAYHAERRGEGAKAATVNYELAVLRRGF